MPEDLGAFWINQLRGRGLAEGGFASGPEGDYRPDASCWAIVALAGDPADRALLAGARSRLAAEQFPDGRVCISADHPEAFWPTALAVFAWHQSPEHRDNQARAAHFLLTSSGKHWRREANSPASHDPNLKGWSWIADTHAWVEPTALAMLALELAGYGNHERVKEGTRLLLDRQLPRGGWNYGNTFVFDQELRPMPLSTGIALNALKDQTSLASIQRSLTYLQSRVVSLTTPRSLGWSLLGLGAWGARPQPSPTLIYACLKNQARYGAYDTASLALLMVALKSPGGLEGIFSEPGKS
ncbi:MAG: hypothetical protein WBV23_02415 [Desulfobaccales bacterium]